MGFKLQLRILSYVWTIQIDSSVHQVMSEEEQIQKMIAMGVLSQESDDETHKDSEGNRIIGFQGNN